MIPLKGGGGIEPGEGARLGEAFHVGHLPLVHELLRQLGSHAVQAADDDAVHLGLLEARLLAERADHVADRPGQEGEEGEDEGQEEDEERSDEGEPCAGADVGVGRRGPGEKRGAGKGGDGA